MHSLADVGPEKAVVIASCSRADDAAEGEATAVSFIRADDAFARADDAAEGEAAWLNERRIYSTR